MISNHRSIAFAADKTSFSNTFYVHIYNFFMILNITCDARAQLINVIKPIKRCRNCIARGNHV